MGQIHRDVAYYMNTHRDDEPWMAALASTSELTRVERKDLPEFPGLPSTFLFIRPDRDSLLAAYGFDRELLVVKSPYREFQPKAIQIAEKFLAYGLAQARAEQICFFFVANSPSLADDVRGYILTHPQSRLIIPISLQDLAQRQRIAVEESVRSHLSVRDLFYVEQPLVDDSFYFGRANLLSTLVTRVRSGENTALLGLRKSGKTSTLLKVQRLLKQEPETVVMYVDCESPGVYNRTWYGLLEHIVRGVSTEAQFPLSTKVKFLESDAPDLFASALGRLFDQASSVKRVLLILDEVEHIAPQTCSAPHWNDHFFAFWQTIRAFQVQDRRFSVLIAGVNGHAVESPAFAGRENPLFSLARPIYLPGFTVLEAQDMIEGLAKFMGMRFTEDAVRALVDEYGGHPMLIRMACSWHYNETSHQARPVEITRDAILGDRQKRNSVLQLHVEHILHVLQRWYELEYELLERLALGDLDTYNDYRTEVPLAVQHLVDYGLVSNRAGRPTISVSLVERYLQDRASVSTPNLGVRADDVNLDLYALISKARNEMEIKLKRLVRETLRSHLGTRWINALVEILPEDKRGQLVGLDAGVILSDHVYLSQLIDVVLRHWKYFRAFEQAPQNIRLTKEQLQVILQYVNAERVDAHAKPVSDVEAVAVLAACRAATRAIDAQLRA